jgi:hypothetical protein
VTTNIFEGHFTQLDRKLGAENHEVVLSVDQCAAHPKNTFLSNIEVLFLAASQPAI